MDVDRATGPVDAAVVFDDVALDPMRTAIRGRFFTESSAPTDLAAERARLVSFCAGVPDFPVDRVRLGNGAGC